MDDYDDSNVGVHEDVAQTCQRDERKQISDNHHNEGNRDIGENTEAKAVNSDETKENLDKNNPSAAEGSQGVGIDLGAQLQEPSSEYEQRGDSLSTEENDLNAALLATLMELTAEEDIEEVNEEAAISTNGLDLVTFGNDGLSTGAERPGSPPQLTEESSINRLQSENKTVQGFLEQEQVSMPTQQVEKQQLPQQVQRLSSSISVRSPLIQERLDESPSKSVSSFDRQLHELELDFMRSIASHDEAPDLVTYCDDDDDSHRGNDEAKREDKSLNLQRKDEEDKRLAMSYQEQTEIGEAIGSEIQGKLLKGGGHPLNETNEADSPQIESSCPQIFKDSAEDASIQALVTSKQEESTKRNFEIDFLQAALDDVEEDTGYEKPTGSVIFDDKMKAQAEDEEKLRELAKKPVESSKDAAENAVEETTFSQNDYSMTVVSGNSTAVFGIDISDQRDSFRAQGIAEEGDKDGCRQSDSFGSVNDGIIRNEDLLGNQNCADLMVKEEMERSEFFGSEHRREVKSESGDNKQSSFSGYGEPLDRQVTKTENSALVEVQQTRGPNPTSEEANGATTVSEHSKSDSVGSLGNAQGSLTRTIVRGEMQQKDVLIKKKPTEISSGTQTIYSGNTSRTTEADDIVIPSSSSSPVTSELQGNAIVDMAFESRDVTSVSKVVNFNLQLENDAQGEYRTFNTLSSDVGETEYYLENLCGDENVDIFNGALGDIADPAHHNAFAQQDSGDNIHNNQHTMLAMNDISYGNEKMDLACRERPMSNAMASPSTEESNGASEAREFLQKQSEPNQQAHLVKELNREMPGMLIRADSKYGSEDYTSSQVILNGEDGDKGKSEHGTVENTLILIREIPDSTKKHNEEDKKKLISVEHVLLGYNDPELRWPQNEIMTSKDEVSIEAAIAVKSDSVDNIHDKQRAPTSLETKDAAKGSSASNGSATELDQSTVVGPGHNLSQLQRAGLGVQGMTSENNTITTAVTPIARTRKIIDGVPTGVDPPKLNVKTGRTILDGKAGKATADAITPDASNVSLRQSEHASNEMKGPDCQGEQGMIGDLQGHAEQLSRMGNEAFQSFGLLLKDGPDFKEESLHDPGILNAPNADTPGPSETSSDGGASDRLRSSDNGSDAQVRQIFRDAGDLNIDDALAGPSFVQPESSSISFEVNVARPKRIEFSSSVASVSSTISASSTVRNIPEIAPPVVPRELVSRPGRSIFPQRPSDRDDSTHSVHSSSYSIHSFSNRSRNSKFESNESFAEVLANKLESASTGELSSQWIKKTKVETFDPSESVFAFMSDEEKSPEISEPGSPAEPNLDDDSSFDSAENESVRRQTVFQAASVWDMLPRPKVAERSKLGEDIEQRNVIVTPDADDSESLATEIGNLSISCTNNNSNVPAQSPDTSTVSTVGKAGKRRRGLLRQLSVEFGEPRRQKKGSKGKPKYRFDPSFGFRSERSFGGTFDDDDTSDIFSIAGGSVVDARASQNRCETGALTVSEAMTEKQREVLLEREARARERGMPSSKDNAISLDAFFSSNRKSPRSQKDVQESPLVSPEASHASLTDFDGAASRGEREPRDNFESEPVGQCDDLKLPTKEMQSVHLAAEQGRENPIAATQTVADSNAQRDNFPEKSEQNADQLRQSLIFAESMFDDEQEKFDDSIRDFCSPEPMRLPINLPIGGHPHNEGSIRWKQLQARWKHAEIINAISSNYPTQQYLKTKEQENQTDEESQSSVSTFPLKKVELNLLEPLGPDDMRWKNRDGFQPHHGERSLPIVSGFIFQLGKSPFENTSHVKHRIGSSQRNLEKDACDILLEKAKFFRNEFDAILMQMLEFSSPQQARGKSAFYSIDVKSREAIMRKAKLKYHDDILCVKDILRGQIIFPNEGALVCALLRLEQMCRQPQKLGDGDETTTIAVERAKNTFMRDESGSLIKSNLPTGYRHVLLTISFGGFLAEIQCQLMQLYDVFGEDGRALHIRLRYGSKELVPSGSEILFLGLMDRIVRDGPPLKSNDIKVKLPIEMHHKTQGNNSAGANVTILSSYWSQEATFEPFPPKGELQDAIRSMISEGVQSAQESPRDISNLHCLIKLLSDVLSHQAYELTKNERVDVEYIEYFRSSLCSCLDLVEQTCSYSMFGWLSVDETKPLDRLAERPLDILHEIGCLFATFGQWGETEEIFRSLLSRCENHLPFYHPRVISALFDVAIAARNCKKRKIANEFIAQASDRLSSFLTEMERTQFVHHSQSSEAIQPGGPVAQQDFGRCSLQILDAYSSMLQALLERKIVGVVGPANDIVLLHYCLVGDCMVVLANCLKLAESCVAGDIEALSRDSKHYWRLAFAHYRIAFKGYSTSNRVGKPLVALAWSAYGSARCLRELGECKTALELLSIVLGTLLPENTKDTEGSMTQDQEYIPNNDIPPKSRFLPHLASTRLVGGLQKESQRFVVASDCLWLMAVLTVDIERNDEGRIRSLKLLHKGSVSLQYALKILHPSSEDMRASCIELLRKIEDEAKSILRPIRSTTSRVPDRVTVIKRSLLAPNVY